MIFTLEALRAQHGDCLLLHYGTADKPQTVLIDGGPGAVYGTTLKPRLLEIRERLVAQGRITAAEPLPLALAMVSHMDDDHIGGLLALADDADGGLGLAHDSWVQPGRLWHNTFDDLALDPAPIADVALGGDLDAEDAPHKTAAVIASVSQARQLRSRAEVLHWTINTPFDGLVAAPPTGGKRVRLDDATTLLVVGPRSDEIEALRKEWAKQIEKLKAGETFAAKIAEYVDKSPYNLSSIVCLAEQDDQRILLTGDARGDLILSALDAAGVTTDGELHVDILKIPHHGSIRDVDADFFERITARHYVISASGRYGNPETRTLELISRSRPDDDFTIHLTYRQGEKDLGERITAFIAARDAANRTFGVEAREDPALSVSIDLADPPTV